MTTAVHNASSTLLVVDDEPLIRMATSEYFRECGWRVLEAGSAEEARALLTQGGPVDVVFSDVQMSRELDGIALAQWVSENHPDTLMLLTSGASRLSDIPTAICAQASTFKKPYRCAAVAARIAVLANEKRLAEQNGTNSGPLTHFDAL